jgi:hypothetical protein
VTQVGSALQINWAAPQSTPTTTAPDGYLVTFHTGPASGISASTIVASSRTGLQTNLSVDIPPGTTGTYTVVVAAFSGTSISGLGGASDPVTFTIGGGGGCSGPPPTPANVEATRSSLVRLAWSNSPGASNYRVLAQVPPANTTIFDGLVGNVTEVSGAVDPATPLRLSVGAVNGCGQSPLSAPVLLTAGGGPVVCVPDDWTMCVVDGRFLVQLAAQPPGGTPGRATVTRRFNDGGGFSFVSGSGIEDLFMRIENRCSSSGAYVVTITNRSGFTAGAGFELLVSDAQGGISRIYQHPPGTQFVSFQDTQNFNSCP